MRSPRLWRAFILRKRSHNLVILNELRNYDVRTSGVILRIITAKYNLGRISY